VREREVCELLSTVRDEHGTTAAASKRFRMALVRRFYADYAHVHGGAAMLDGKQIERALRTSGLRAALDAAWPPLRRSASSARLADAAFLAEAADGVLDESEQRLLRRRGAGGASPTWRSSTRRRRSSGRRPGRTATSSSTKRRT
jgi:hypothetical protein